MASRVLIPVLVAHLLLLALFSVPVAAGELESRLAAEISNSDPDQFISVIINLTDRVPIAELNQTLKEAGVTRAQRHAHVIDALRAAAARSQGPVIESLAIAQAAGDVGGYTPYWISNLIVASVRAEYLQQFSQRVDIDVIEKNFVVDLIRPIAEGRWMGDLGVAGAPGRIDPGAVGVTPGLRAINADRCWYELGLTGAGRLICGFDTGVVVQHPALSTRWRGYDGAHPMQECWFDALTDSIGEPYDDDGHGTHTMGTMCGVDPAAGDTVGVAFGAKWIAANTIGQPGWNDEFDNDVIATFQWVADPDGDSQTIDDVPDVCQNSWGGREVAEEDTWYRRCDDLWWEVIDNCEAAGIVITYSAGNSGPEFMSCGIPADRSSTPWNVFAVGAVDATNYPAPYPIADFSSRGPSGCDELSIKPEVSAPGVDVVSCSSDSVGYRPESGTSMAGPHVAGVVALMREIDPDLDVDRIKQILMDTAIDYGDAGEDNIFGWGLIDAYAACLAVTGGYGNLSGCVTTVEFQPLQGVSVSIPELGRSAVTDAAGNYQLRHLPAGSYSLTAERFGYVSQSPQVSIADQQLQVVDLSLTMVPQGYLRGLVRSEEDVIEGVVIDIMDGPIEKQLTDANGAFLFEGLPERSYFVSAGRFGWIPRTETVTVVAGETTAVEFTTSHGILDNFEIDQGWIIGQPGDTAFEGIWQRCDPNPTIKPDSSLVAPGDDATPDGTHCYVTHNAPEFSYPAWGDVDGGGTTITSPVFDMTGYADATLNFEYWLHNMFLYPHEGQLRIDMSNNAGELWRMLWLESDPHSGGWSDTSISLSHLTITRNMQLRFIARDDAASAAVVEVGLDDVYISGLTSSVENDLPLCVLRLYRPQPNPVRGATTLRFSLPRDQDIDFAIFDTAGRLVQRLQSGMAAAGNHTLHWDGTGADGRQCHSGVYFLRLVTEGARLDRKIVVTR